MENLPQSNKNELSLKSQFVASSTLKPKEREVVEFYGTNFFTDVCPQFPSRDREANYPTLQSSVEDDSAPSLVTIDNIYGNGASEMWISVQLLEVLIYTGLREKMTTEQRNALARQLRKMGYYCKLSEMMQFFTRFEQGYYKTFQGYERPNPQVITQSFLSFLDDLEEARGLYAEKQRAAKEDAERKKWDEEAVPCPEHIKEKLDKLFQHTDANVQLSKQTNPEQ